jgi:hypothetical protein
MVWEYLKGIDYKIALQTKAKGCVECGGTLDWACFPRKPRGIEGLDSERRMSFCCRQCRKRSTPGSLRFLWKKIYVLFVVATEPVTGAVGVCRRTISRWRSFWASELSVRSQLCGHFRYLLPVEFNFTLPALISNFLNSVDHDAAGLCRFLSPLGCAMKLRFIKLRADDAF